MSSIILSSQNWANKTHEEFGCQLEPSRGESWEDLYSKLHSTIFASPTETLHRASMLGCERAVQRIILIDGHDVDELDSHGYTPLIHAVWNSRVSSVQMLLRLEADIEKEFHYLTPLYYALIGLNRGLEDASEIARMIIDKSSRIEFSIIKLVASQMNKIGLRLLLDRGFDVNLTDISGNTTIHDLVSSSDIDKIRKIKWMISHGAKINIPNNQGETPLHIAMGMKDLPSIEVLLSHQADVFAVDKSGNGCISWALFEGDPEQVIARERQQIKLDLIIWGLTVAPYVLKAYDVYRRLFTK